MRKFIALIMLFSVLVNASSTTFSSNKLNEFYDLFLCEEKEVLSSAGLTVPCGYNPSPSSHTTPPDPIPPPSIVGYLPIVLVNNSTLPDNEVYVVVTGKDASLTQSFLQIDSNGIGKLVEADPGDNALNYTKTLSQLVQNDGTFVFYLPQTVAGIIWFSMELPLNMPVNAPHNIVQPDFAVSPDPNGNYDTNFDIFEITYVPPGPGITSISGDATAVNAFSIPLYGFMSTPAPGTPSHTGLYQPRSYIMAQAASTFATYATSGTIAQWNKLFLMNGSTILRLLSTGKSMSVPVFDQNYLDNSAAYGYSYISDIWSGASTPANPSFYRTHPLVLTIPNGSGDTYTGTINGGNTITFVSSPHGYTVVLAAPTTTVPTTSFNIFSGLFFIASDNSPGAADGIQLNKLLEEAIIAGLVPTANTLSNDYLLANQANYYKVNPNLTATGQATGPWYDLYSKALHALGSIYTFAYDEPLWPQVQIASETLEPTTYLGITIGSIQ